MPDDKDDEGKGDVLRPPLDAWKAAEVELGSDVDKDAPTDPRPKDIDAAKPPDVMNHHEFPEAAKPRHYGGRRDVHVGAIPGVDGLWLAVWTNEDGTVYVPLGMVKKALYDAGELHE